MNKVNYQNEMEKIIGRLESRPTLFRQSRPTLFLHSCCAPCSSYCMEYTREHFDVTVFYYNPNISSEEEYIKRLEEEKRLIEAFNKQVETGNFVVIGSNVMNTAVGEVVLTNETSSKEPSNNAQNAAMNSECSANDTSKAESTQNISLDDERSANTTSNEGFLMNSTSRATKIQIVEGDYLPQDFYDMAKGLEQCPEGGNRCFKCYELRLRETFRVAKEQGFDYVASTLTISPLKNAEKINEIGFALAEEYGVSWLPCDFKKKNGYKRSIELCKIFDLYRQNFCGCVFSRRD